jgi:hypothetical protein
VCLAVVAALENEQEKQGQFGLRLRPKPSCPCSLVRVAASAEVLFLHGKPGCLALESL